MKSFGDFFDFDNDGYLDPIEQGIEFLAIKKLFEKNKYHDDDDDFYLSKKEEKKQNEK